MSMAHQPKAMSEIRTVKIKDAHWLWGNLKPLLKDVLGFFNEANQHGVIYPFPVVQDKCLPYY